jgi:hypothetical protein
MHDRDVDHDALRRFLEGTLAPSRQVLGLLLASVEALREVLIEASG